MPQRAPSAPWEGLPLAPCRYVTTPLAQQSPALSDTSGLCSTNDFMQHKSKYISQTNCSILRLHTVRWGFMLFFFPTERLSIMQLYCCIWLVGLVRIYSSCSFSLSWGEELPAEVMRAQSWPGKMPHFISCQAVEALMFVKNNSLQKWQAVIKVCSRKHSFSGKNRNQWKINPALQTQAPSCRLQPAPGRIASCLASHQGCSPSHGLWVFSYNFAVSPSA